MNTNMNIRQMYHPVVFIVPTGVGAKIGGHAGDATPALKSIVQAGGFCVTHPNVVNASAINEMPELCLYVEGSMLDCYLENSIGLKLVNSNRILAVHNGSQYVENLCRAASETIGADIIFRVLNTKLVMEGFIKDGIAIGKHYGIDELIKQVKTYDFDALAIITPITVPPSIAKKYFKDGGVNPWGGIEAIISHKISDEIKCPVAHAPSEDEKGVNDELTFISYFEPIRPAQAAEAVSSNYAHCVFKGLHKAPRVCSPQESDVGNPLCLVTPMGVFGRPHKACIDRGIPIIGVRSNTTNCTAIEHSRIHYVNTYYEAAGLICAWRAGVDYGEF